MNTTTQHCARCKRLRNPPFCTFCYEICVRCQKTKLRRNAQCEHCAYGRPRVPDDRGAAYMFHPMNGREGFSSVASCEASDLHVKATPKLLEAVCEHAMELAAVPGCSLADAVIQAEREFALR